MKISSQICWIFVIIAFIFIASCGNETDSGLQNALDTRRMTKDINEADAYTAPKGSLIINSGATATASTSATLTLTANDAVGVTAYYTSENSSSPSSNFTGWNSISSVDSFSDNISFTLSSDEGSKTVYVWFKDGSGNVSSVVSDSIILDMTAPIGSISIDKESSYSSYGYYTVSLSLSATDNLGVTGYYFSTSSSTPSASSSGWTSVNSTTSLSMTASERIYLNSGWNYFYIWYKDSAGNVSSVVSDSIILDITAPTGSISIDNESSYSSGYYTVSLSLSATDSVGVTGYYFSTTSSTPSTSSSGWTSVTSTTSLSKTVSKYTYLNGREYFYVWYKDSAGNVSSRYKDSMYCYSSSCF